MEYRKNGESIPVTDEMNLLVPVGRDYSHRFLSNVTLMDGSHEIQRNLTMWVDETETVYFSISNIQSKDGKISYQCILTATRVPGSDHRFIIIT